MHFRGLTNGGEGVGGPRVIENMQYQNGISQIEDAADAGDVRKRIYAITRKEGTRRQDR